MTATILKPAPMTRTQVIARLEDWRERLLETKAGTVNTVLTLPEIRAHLDRLLDDLNWLDREQP